MNPTKDKLKQISAMTYTLRRVCSQSSMAIRPMEDDGLVVHTAEWANALVAGVEARMWERTVYAEKTDEQTVPVTWWDGFKLAWFPLWAQRRWPPKTRTITTELQVVHVCPHIPTDQGSRDLLVHHDFMAGPLIRRHP